MRTVRSRIVVVRWFVKSSSRRGIGSPNRGNFINCCIKPSPLTVYKFELLLLPLQRRSSRSDNQPFVCRA